MGQLACSLPWKHPLSLPQACRGVHSGPVKCAKDWARFRIVVGNIIIRMVERCYGQGGCSETLVDRAEPPASNHLSRILGNKCGYMCFISIFFLSYFKFHQYIAGHLFQFSFVFKRIV